MQMISFTSILRLSSWTDLLLNCKEYENLVPKHNIIYNKSDDKLNGSFRFTTYYNNPKDGRTVLKTLNCLNSLAIIYI